MRLLNKWVSFFPFVRESLKLEHTKPIISVDLVQKSVGKTNTTYFLEQILFIVLYPGCGMPASRGRRAATPTTYYSISSRRHKFRRFERRRTILTKASRLVRHVFLTLLTLTCYLLMTNNRRLDNSSASSSNVLTAFISRLRDSSGLN